VAFVAFLIPAIFWIYLLSNKKNKPNQSLSFGEVYGIFITYFAVYIIFTILITGSFLSFYRIEQFLYILNFGLILTLIPKATPLFTSRKAHPQKWAYMVLGILVFIGLISLIAISSHGEMPGMNKRF